MTVLESAQSAQAKKEDESDKAMITEIACVDPPVISHYQDGVLWVERDLGELGLLDNLLLTESIMLVLCQVVDMHLHGPGSTFTGHACLRLNLV